MKTADFLITAIGCAAAGMLAVAGTAVAAPAPECIAKLHAAPRDAGVACLESLRGSRAETLGALPALTRLLRGSDGFTDYHLILAALDALRGLGAAARPAAESVSALLPYRAAIYRQRDKQISLRLRTYLFATLADIGVPESAEPAVLDVLANFDERVEPGELGAAARAAGALGARGAPLAPYLVSLLSTRLSEEQFTLVNHGLQFAPSESTTVQIEALRALGNVADCYDSSVLEALEHFTGAADADGFDPRAVQAARTAAGRIEVRAPATSQSRSAVDPWIAVDARAVAPDFDVPVTDQDGMARRLESLLDRPVLVAFFYTRCQNDAKCSMTLLHLANLQRLLASGRLSDKVRLLAITYEPQHDTPERLMRFATDRGFAPGKDALLLRVDPAWQQQVIDELLVPVSYNTAWVSAHGVECSLLDASGRLVRKYSTVLWDNEAVVRDLERLLAEGARPN
jgi:protein SCO1/2